MKCAVYICDFCGFEEPIPIKDLRPDYTFDEKDLKTFPSFECHGCHTYQTTIKKIEDLPDSWFPDITPEEYYSDI
jgi:hypothetical protein